MVGNLEPEERVLNWDIHEKRMLHAVEDGEDPLSGWREGKVYPVSSSTTQLLGDLSKAFYEVGWSPEDIFEVQTAGTFKKDKFICIKNRSLEK